jgi:hypothetical protein
MSRTATINRAGSSANPGHIDEFRRPRGATEDTTTAWNGLTEHLDPT